LDERSSTERCTAFGRLHGRINRDLSASGRFRRYCAHTS
jgi:hypothetical protein